MGQLAPGLELPKDGFTCSNLQLPPKEDFGCSNLQLPAKECTNNLQLPSKEERYRYCCHISGEPPIELQLLSPRTEAAHQRALLAAARSQGHWPPNGPPGQVRAFPAIPTGQQRQHFPEVVRRRAAREAAERARAATERGDAEGQTSPTGGASDADVPATDDAPAAMQLRSSNPSHLGAIPASAVATMPGHAMGRVATMDRQPPKRGGATAAAAELRRGLLSAPRAAGTSASSSSSSTAGAHSFGAAALAAAPRAASRQACESQAAAAALQQPRGGAGLRVLHATPPPASGEASEAALEEQEEKASVAPAAAAAQAVKQYRPAEIPEGPSPQGEVRGHPTLMQQRPQTMQVVPNLGKLPVVR